MEGECTRARLVRTDVSAHECVCVARLVGEAIVFVAFQNSPSSGCEEELSLWRTLSQRGELLLTTSRELRAMRGRGRALYGEEKEGGEQRAAAVGSRQADSRRLNADCGVGGPSSSPGRSSSVTHASPTTTTLPTHLTHTHTHRTSSHCPPSSGVSGTQSKNTPLHFSLTRRTRVPVSSRRARRRVVGA